MLGIGRKAAEEAHAKSLRGMTMRMYMRISRVGDREEPTDEVLESEGALLWSDRAQLESGRQFCAEYDLVYDETESKAHQDPDKRSFRGEWKKRKGLFAHYQDACRGEFQVLGLYMGDRLGRNVIETVSAIAEFQKLGIYIYVADREMLIAPDDRENMNLLFQDLVEAEKYSLRLSKRVGSAHRMRSQSSRHHGGPPPGWMKWNKESRKYEQVDLVVKAFHEIIRLRLEGRSEGAIARLLNESGSRTIKNRRWRQSTINRYLTPLWIDKMLGYSHYTPSKQEPIRTPNPVWKPIISDELAERLKGVLASSGKVHSYRENFLQRQNAGVTKAINASVPFLVSGMMFCSECHARMQSRSGFSNGQRGRYACNGYLGTKSGHAGIQKYFSRDQIEDAVVAALAVWLVSPPPPIMEFDDTDMRCARLQAEQSRLNKSIDKLFDLFDSGDITKEDYLRKKNALTSEREEVARRAAQATRPIISAEVAKLSIGPDRVQLRQLVYLLASRIEVPIYPDGAVPGTREPTPYVRVMLRVPMEDGAVALLSPIIRKGGKIPRRVIGEHQ